MKCILLILCVCFFPLTGLTDSDKKEPVGQQEVPCEVILKKLTDKKNEQLNEYISFLKYDLNKSYLSNPQINRIIEKLREIQKTDSYNKRIELKGGERVVYPNRNATESCIYRFRFQKVANRLRKLPMKQRIAEIVEKMRNFPTISGYNAMGSFGQELVVAGKEAVPFIIKHKPQQPYVRRQIADALAEIGDPRGKDYIIEVLKTKGDTFSAARGDAASALGNFEGEKVIKALIQALEDETYRKVVRNPTCQRRNDKTHREQRDGRYYVVQHKASLSLSRITGNDWGLLYNEDYKTWFAWFQKEHRKTFAPGKVERNQRNIESLINLLFHRYMSGRPNPDQPQNVLDTSEGIKSIANDLTPVGKSVVPVIVKEYEKQVNRSPIWRKKLQEWTQDILQALPWDEAARTAKKINTRESGVRPWNL